MAIDELVKTNAMALSLIERAINDPHGWSLVCGREVADAAIEVSDTSITIRAAFEDTDPNEGSVDIYHRGSIVWSRPVNHGGGSWEVAWTWHVEGSLIVCV